MLFAFLKPETARLLLLTVIGGAYLGYHILPGWRQWKGRRRKHEQTRTYPSSPAAESGGGLKSASTGGEVRAGDRSAPSLPTSTVQSSTASQPTVDLPTADDQTPHLGEAIYRQARELPHQKIPDFETDGEYLEALGKAAGLGYAPALAKLGDYAMRRAAWVEAYYWMSRARKAGMRNLSATLREIRAEWLFAGLPAEEDNVHALFSAEAGSIGRALLTIASGRGTRPAKEYLRAHHPEFLDE